MSTKLDQQWANGILDGVQAFKREIERLEEYSSKLEEKLSFKNVERAYYQATNFIDKKTGEVIKRLHQELNS